jgi:hypothetical protein
MLWNKLCDPREALVVVLEKGSRGLAVRCWVGQSLQRGAAPPRPHFAPPPDADPTPLHDDLPPRDCCRSLRSLALATSGLRQDPQILGSAANGNLLRPFRPHCSHPTWDSQQLAPAENRSVTQHPGSLSPCQRDRTGRTEREGRAGHPPGRSSIQFCFPFVACDWIIRRGWQKYHQTTPNLTQYWSTIDYRGVALSSGREETIHSSSPLSGPGTALQSIYPRPDICNHDHDHNRSIPSPLGTTRRRSDSP